MYLNCHGEFNNILKPKNFMKKKSSDLDTVLRKIFYLEIFFGKRLS